MTKFYGLQNHLSNSQEITIAKITVQNRITEEIGKDPKPFRALWNGIDEEWKY